MTYQVMTAASLEMLRQKDPMEFVKTVRLLLKAVPGYIDKNGMYFSKAGKTFLPLSARQVSQMQVIGISEFIKSKYRNLYLYNELNGLTYMVVAFSTAYKDPYKDDYRRIKYYAVVMDTYTYDGKLIGELFAKQYKFNVHFSNSQDSEKGRYRLRTTINDTLFEIEDILIQSIYSNIRGTGCHAHHKNYKFDLRRDSIVYLEPQQHREEHKKKLEQNHNYNDKCVGDGVIPIMTHKTIK